MAGSPLVCDQHMSCVCHGQYRSNVTTVACDPCAPGTFAARPATEARPAAHCRPCPFETYSSRRGQAGCVAQPVCLPGTAVAVPATSSSERQCVACDGNRSFTAEV